jgi:hypothetical protein
MMIRRWESSSKNSGKNDTLPPLPPSPAKAKQAYLKSQKDMVFDPQAKILQMNKELDIVRERAAAKLDKEINKSIYRKLTDPLRRYNHSVINVGAVVMAYILAHNLYVNSKREKEVRRELEVSQTKELELQSLLQSLLQPATLQQMASSCVQKSMIEDEEEGTATTKKSSWWTTRSRRRRLTEDSLEERMVQVLKDELERRIGEKGLTEDQRQQKAIDQVWQESKSKVEELSENPEQLLLAFLEEEEEQDAKNKKERRVFSM